MPLRQITLDTETTGFNPKSGHRVIEIGCVELIDRVRTGKVFHCYINPERDVPKDAFRVHGISTEFLKDKQKFSDIADAFLAFVAEDELIIHNAEFDLGFLRHELSLVQRPTMQKHSVIDTVKLARKQFPGSKATLDALCNRFKIDLSKRDKHGALLDAELLADVYIELTGGNQTALTFVDNGQEKGDETAENIAVVRANAHTTFPKRSFPITEEEETAHEAFLEQMGESLWREA